MRADVWMPGLLPSAALREGFAGKVLSRSRFAGAYARQLRGLVSQNFIKPLALLSTRKKVVLLCGCPGPCGCPLQVLARAIRDCRARRDFALRLKPHSTQTDRRRLL